MGRKLKPVGIVGGQSNTVNKNAEPVAIGDAILAASSDTMIDSTPIMTRLNVDEDLKNKIEQLDKVSADNVRLINENSAMQEKLAEYIEELNRLRDNADKLKSEIDALKRDNSELTKKLNEIESRPDPVSETRLKELQDENDSYLMKISELTFNNARLTAQIQSLEAAKSAVFDKSKETLRAAQTDTRASVYRNNGYSAWN